MPGFRPAKHPFTYRHRRQVQKPTGPVPLERGYSTSQNIVRGVYSACPLAVTGIALFQTSFPCKKNGRRLQGGLPLFSFLRNNMCFMSHVIVSTFLYIIWRLSPESNRGPRLCRPLHNHSATQPYYAASQHHPWLPATCHLSMDVAPPSLAPCDIQSVHGHKRKTPPYCGAFENLERETRFELATPTLARLCSTS